LPCSEPEQDEIHPMRARLFHQFVDDRKIESSRLRFKLFPINRRFDRISVNGFNRRPDLRQYRRPCAGVVDLRSQNQERLAVNHQSIAAIFFDEARHFRTVSGKRTHEDADDKKSDWREVTREASHGLDLRLKVRKGYCCGLRNSRKKVYANSSCSAGSSDGRAVYPSVRNALDL